MNIKVGTRKSKLALAQTAMVIEKLKLEFPEINIEIVPIGTKGDRIIDKPLSSFGGKGVFVSEIENALLNGVIDIAVHSAKDLPIELSNGLEISGVLPRGDYRDVLVMRKYEKKGNTDSFVIGTGSLRRRLNIKRLYPHAVFADIRGNVDTRLNKLLNGEYNAIVLACAGLERLGLLSRNEFDFITLDYTECLPAPCQAIIATESRKDDFVTPFIKKINDEDTFKSFETERHVLHLLNADCSMPTAAYSRIKGDIIELFVTKDCNKIVSDKAKISQSFELAERLVKLL